jgi:predicted DNA-binding transcriptional regulator YafY
MESPAARLLGLLSLLQARPHWTAGQLADRLHTTERTVRRDVSRLRELGYPVVAEAGRAGGYRLGAGAALPPLLLSEEEAVAIALGLRAAASSGVSGFEETAVAALAKLEQVLPARLRERVDALTSSTVLVRSGAPSVIGAEVLVTLAQGCRGEERVRFTYRDAAGNETERRVEPYGLVSLSGRWYLVARDLDRSDWRTFRVDRMAGPSLTGHRFTRTEEPDTEAMVLDAVARAPYPWQAEVVLDAGIEEARAEIPRSVGKIEETSDGVTLTMGANDLDWIARYLAGLPFDARVTRPPELRAALVSLGRHLASVHGRRPSSRGRPVS